MQATVTPSNGVVERTRNDQKTLTAALGSTDHVELHLDSSVGLASIARPAFAKIVTRMAVAASVETVDAKFGFSFPESRQDHFAVTLDPSLALVKIDAPNLKSWKIAEQNGKPLLEIILSEPAHHSFEFAITAERPATGTQRRFPQFSADANRIEQTDTLFSNSEVSPQPSPGFRQIQSAEKPDPGMRLVASYWVAGDKETLCYNVNPTKPTDKAQISYVYQVTPSKIELIAALNLRAKGRALYDVTLGLPQGFVVQAVESERLKDWWHDSDTLCVRFKGEIPDSTPLVLHLVKQFKTAPDQLEIAPLSLPDPWQVEGDGIIAAGKSVKAGMSIAGAREIDPQTAATDFRILEPMERKRGFSFKGQDFHAAVKLESLPPRITGNWVMSAQAHESWVSISTHVNLAVRQGSPDGVKFSLPASAPEARVAGGNVRETTSRVEGDLRVYQVAFQTDRLDKMDFNVEFDLPSEGKAALPVFELLNIEHSEGFVIADNASEYEMQLNPARLETALRSQIPFLPQISSNARLFRALPGWGLQIGLAPLEKEVGRDAFVAWAELTTAVRADGSEWNRASYHLKNRSLQFLPVKLPDGVELASVSVAGENVRADRGTVNGKAVLLVPLLKTKPGDVSYDVDLVYRKKKEPTLFGGIRKSLADPEVVGIAVERTLWNLYVPEGNPAPHFGGNMEEVLAEVNQTEKLEGMLNELKQLKNLALMNANSAVSRKATQNFKALEKSLEDDSAILQGESVYKNKESAFKKQSQEVAQRNRVIQDELSQQKLSLNEKQSQIPVTQSGGMAQGNAQPAIGQALQSWASNQGYVAAGKDRDEKTLDQKDAVGNKLYVNDYVMNVQSSQSNIPASPPPAKGPTTRGGSGIAGGSLSLPTSSIGVAAPAQKMIDAPMSPEPATAPVPSNVKVLNNARSNIHNITPFGSAPAAPSEPKPEATGGMADASVRTINQDKIGDRPAPGGVEAPGEDSSFLLQNEGLHPANAISLMVDFPTEGPAYHFKKLKSNAKLTLWRSNPQIIERCKWLLIFAFAAALTHLVFKFKRI